MTGGINSNPCKAGLGSGAIQPVARGGGDSRAAVFVTKIDRACYLARGQVDDLDGHFGIDDVELLLIGGQNRGPGHAPKLDLSDYGFFVLVENEQLVVKSADVGEVLGSGRA